MANPLISPLVLAQLQQAIRQGTLPHAIPLANVGSTNHQVMSTSGQQQRDQVPTASLARDGVAVSRAVSTSRSTCGTTSTSDNTVSNCDYFTPWGTCTLRVRNSIIKPTSGPNSKPKPNFKLHVGWLGSYDLYCGKV